MRNEKDCCHLDLDSLQIDVVQIAAAMGTKIEKIKLTEDVISAISAVLHVKDLSLSLRMVMAL